MAISPTTSLMGTGALILVGTLVEDKAIDLRKVVAIGVIAIGLSIMSETKPDLAAQFGLLIMIGAAFRYVPSISKGLVTNKK